MITSKNLRIAVLAICISIFSTAVFANPISIGYGTNMTSAIQQIGDMQQYSFTGNKGDMIILRMRGTTNGVDACLTLNSPANETVAQKCSGGGIVEIRHTLSSTGIFTIEASDANNNDTGEYGLALHILNNAGFAKPINCGGDVLGSFDHQAAMEAYTFEAKAGDVAYLQMRGATESLESILQLYSPDGTLVYNGEAQGSLLKKNSITLDVSGSYTILTMDNHGNDLDTYGLSVQILTNPECANLLSCGTANTEIKQLAQMEAYYFEADAGQHFRLQALGENPKMEVQLELFDKNGTLLKSTVSSSGMAVISNFEATEDGFFTIVVTDRHGNDDGKIILSFQKLNGNDCAEAIGCGADFYASLEQRAEMDAYTFNANEGDKLIVWMRGLSTNLEAQFKIYGADGKLVEASQKRGRLAFIPATHLSKSGSYTLLVSDENGNDTGDYGISIQIVNTENCGVALECNKPEEVHRLGTLVEIDAYTFTGKANEIISILVSEETSSLEPHIELYAPDGSLVKADADKQTAVIAKQLLPADGQYTLLIMDHEGNDKGNYFIDITAENVGGCQLEYCESTTETTYYEYIKGVVLGSIVNVSTNNGGYGNFTNLSTDLAAGSTNVISLFPGFTNPLAMYYECWRVWIDFNQDGDFDDAGELVFFGSSKSMLLGSIAIPATALTGKTRMRVAMNFNIYPEPCGVSGSGEVEDYSVNITPAFSCGSLPASWTNQDIGSPLLSGLACFINATKTYVVQSGGKDIDKKEDEFQFVHTNLCGDGEIKAHVIGITNTSDNAFAGIMLRNSVDAKAKNVSLLTAASGKTYFQYRNRYDKNTSSSKITTAAPVWLKLVRKGKEIKGYTSVDGNVWVFVNEVELELNVCLEVGLAVTSHDATKINLATFVGVEVSTNNLQNGNGISNLIIQSNTDVEPNTSDIISPNPNQKINQANLQGMQTAQPVKMLIFPNPTSSSMEVELAELQNGPFVLSLYNQLGIKVLEQKMNDGADSYRIRLDVSSMPVGQYQLRIQQGHQLTTKPVIIAR